MTPQQREIAYASSRAAKGQISRAIAIDQIAKSGVTDGSARILVEVFLALSKGEVFKRALSETDMDHFLVGIRKDEGVETLCLALNGFARHIAYRESLGVRQPGNRRLYARHLAEAVVPDVTRRSSSPIADPFDDEVQQSRRDSSAARQKRLRSAKPKPRMVAKVVYVFERNPDVVAEVLEMAKGVCGICGRRAPFMRARDGTPYLEVHHRIMLSSGGDDTVANAVAACPNCHREEHYGNRQ